MSYFEDLTFDPVPAEPEIAGLTDAIGYLACAVRALAQGADPLGADVRGPMHWAVTKIEQVRRL